MDDVAQHLKVSRRLLDLRFREITGRTVLAAIQAVSSARLEAVLAGDCAGICVMDTHDKLAALDLALDKRLERVAAAPAADNLRPRPRGARRRQSPPTTSWRQAPGTCSGEDGPLARAAPCFP